MTANPIRRLLEAKPFVRFTLHFGFENEIEIKDPDLCRLDSEDLILFVSSPKSRPPEVFRKLGVAGMPATVEIIDLRHVLRVTAHAEQMPG